MLKVNLDLLGKAIENKVLKEAAMRHYGNDRFETIKEVKKDITEINLTHYIFLNQEYEHYTNLNELEL